MYRIGVDVGGTNTDSAILDIKAVKQSNRGVLASCKTPTTADVTSGITRAVEDVLAKSKVAKEDVLSVTIGMSCEFRFVLRLMLGVVKLRSHTY
jgi:N-methylhydantoinase A/oxoprolinase/acetone carboxylase beta subunit